MQLIYNRKAGFNYEILEKYTAGIVLHGYEVKALREKKGNLDGAFVKLEGGEAFVTGMSIAPYSKQSQDIEELDRPRKLLLNSYEMDRISKELREKGKSAVPLAVVLEHNLIKLEFAVVKGKKKFDKKRAEKERQIEKDERLSAGL